MGCLVFTDDVILLFFSSIQPLKHNGMVSLLIVKWQGTLGNDIKNAIMDKWKASNMLHEYAKVPKIDFTRCCVQVSLYAFLI